jgi:hypothetical protein
MHGTLPKKQITKEERLAELREVVPFMPIHEIPRKLLRVEQIAALLYIAECFERNKDPVEGYSFDMFFVTSERHICCNTSACICGDMLLLTYPGIGRIDARTAFNIIVGPKRVYGSHPLYGLQRLFMPWVFQDAPSFFWGDYNNRPDAAHAIRTYLETNEPEWIL